MVHEVVRNRLKYVDHYLQSGVPIDATAIGQTTVMHALSLSEKSPSILADCDYLLAKGANIDAAGTSGRSALMNCFGEDGAGMELAKHLISRGANTTVADIEGSTIFHIAAISGSADSCRIIAATGLDHNVHDKNGFTPVYDAATHNNVDVVRYFVEELKVDPNQKNGVGEPILYGAIIAPGPETMEYLLQNPHIRVDERNSVGETVFHSAARRGNTGAVYALVKSGADPLIPTQSGKTVVEELRSTLNPQEFQELGQAIAQAMADRTSHAHHHKRKSTASAASTQAAAAVTPTSAPGAPQLAAQPAVKRVHHTP